MSKSHQIIFVTGKGGVGKSMVAAATAVEQARQGKSVLLAEMGGPSFYNILLREAFADREVGYEPINWRPGIDIACWDLEQTLLQHLSHYLMFEKAAQKVMSHTLMRALVGAAPALAELAMLGKLTAPMRHKWYRRDVDVVVVDAFPSGQFLALLRAPKGMSKAISVGPMGKQSRWISELLADAAVTQYRVVTLPETLPLIEAQELAADIEQEVGQIPAIICNKVVEGIADIGLSPGQDPFLQHLQRVDQQQRHVLEALQGQTGAVLSLPMVWQLEAERIIDALADDLATANQNTGRESP